MARKYELISADVWSAPQFADGGAEDGTAMLIESRSGPHYRALTRINKWDGPEHVACVLFQIAQLRTPDNPRCPKALDFP